MPWNGSGSVNRTDGTRAGTQVWQDAEDAGVKIRADDHDTHDQDLADAIENTVALDGQNTTTTDNSLIRYDTGNSKYLGVAISASQFVGRGSSGDIKGINTASARAILGVGSATPTNSQALFWSSASNKYIQKTPASARSTLGLGTAAPTTGSTLYFSSASNQYVQEVTLRQKVINIGDWNMDSTANVNVAHGLTQSTIRNVQVLIRDDTDGIYEPLNTAYSSGSSAGYFLAGSANINLYRLTSGHFDNPAYDATSFNRGWITIWYTG